MRDSYMFLAFLWIFILWISCHFVDGKVSPSLRDREQLPWCSPENLPLHSAHTPRLRLLNSGLFDIEYDHCRLREMNPTQVTNCLKGMLTASLPHSSAFLSLFLTIDLFYLSLSSALSQTRTLFSQIVSTDTHLVFIGDSLTRFLYVTLAHALAHGEWMNPMCKSVSGSSTVSDYSNGCRRYHESWAKFFEHSNSALNVDRNDTVSVEICDCSRGEEKDSFPWMFENRYFFLRSKLSQEKVTERTISRTTDDSSSNRHLESDPDTSLLRLSYFALMGDNVRGNQQVLKKLSKEFWPSTHRLKNLSSKICRNESFIPLSNQCILNRFGEMTDMTQLQTGACKYITNSRLFHQNSTTIQNVEEAKEYEIASQKCNRFAETALNHIGATHVIFNTGLHRSVRSYGGYQFLKEFARSVERYTKPSMSSSNSDSLTLNMPRFIFRESTKPVENEPEDTYKQFSKDQEYSELLGFFHLREITEKMNFIGNNYQNHMELQAFLKDNVTLPDGFKFGVSKIYPTFVDTTHYHPWVNHLIHKIFFNRVCSVSRSTV